jgi:16S rRNA (adenine1518-N6/adenine1519-N6)-dimethyltransferase
MSKNDIVQLLAALNLRPSRRLGQNFLIDNNILDIIVRHATSSPQRRIIEVGPGSGVLTERLAELAPVTAIEFDVRLAAYLQDKFVDADNVTIVAGDGARQDYDELAAGLPYDLIANLPYSVSTAILGHLLTTENRPRRILVLLQREMAARLTAQPRTKAYGALTVRLRTCFDVKTVKQVSPNVFWPVPEVDSSLVLMQLRADAPDRLSCRRLKSLVAFAFSQRRKKLARVLSRLYTQQSIDCAFESLGLALDIRADAMQIADYETLAETLVATSTGNSDS